MLFSRILFLRQIQASKRCFSDLLSFDDDKLKVLEAWHEVFPPNKGQHIEAILKNEPELLKLSPEEVIDRHRKIETLQITHSKKEFWAILFNAPRGFFLQEWHELTKKIFYIDDLVLPFIYDKKELQAMLVHPLVKAASVVQLNFDQIRIRYLFAYRTGYKSQLEVQSYLEKPGLREMMLTDHKTYLKTFTPCLTEEEYLSFSNLIKNYDLDGDDADTYEMISKVYQTKLSKQKDSK